MHSVQDNATTLGVVGGIALLWSSLSLFSALESAFNIVYGRPNRSFLHGKGVAAVVMVATITTLFISLVIGALGVEIVKRYAPGFVANSVAAYILSIAVSLLGVFVFVLAAYRLLTNADVSVRDVLPGAVLAAIVLEALVPGRAGLRAARGREPRPARARRPGDPPALALRDGERDRLRRRGQLVVLGAARATQRAAAPLDGLA